MHALSPPGVPHPFSSLPKPPFALLSPLGASSLAEAARIRTYLMTSPSLSFMVIFFTNTLSNMLQCGPTTHIRHPTSLVSTTNDLYMTFTFTPTFFYMFGPSTIPQVFSSFAQQYPFAHTVIFTYSIIPESTICVLLALTFFFFDYWRVFYQSHPPLRRARPTLRSSPAL